MSRYRTRSGIVLRRLVTNEGDVILDILTPEGKVRGVARAGVRGPRAARLNLFQHLTFQSYERPGPAGGLATLTQVVLEGALPGLAHPDRYPYAHLLCELADRLWQENDHVGQAGFELFTGGLRGLVRHGDPDRVALVIAWKLLGLAGMFPRVGRCLETGSPDGLTHFDPRAGGVTTGLVARGLPVGVEATGELARVARETVREVLAAPLSSAAREGLWRALEAYTVQQTGELQAWGAVRVRRSAALAPAPAA